TTLFRSGQLKDFLHEFQLVEFMLGAVTLDMFQGCWECEIPACRTLTGKRLEVSSISALRPRPRSQLIVRRLHPSCSTGLECYGSRQGDVCQEGPLQSALGVGKSNPNASRETGYEFCMMDRARGCKTS